MFDQCMTTYTVLTFYKFMSIEDIHHWQLILKESCSQKNLLGSILIASEGINCTLVGKPSDVEDFLNFLKTESIFLDLDIKFSYCDFLPFNKLKVLLKNEIVALKRPNIDPEAKTGIHVPPKDWDDLISKPDVMVIDTRNNYEIALGTFKNAINPNTETFNEFPNFVQQNLLPYKNKRLALFCTGGIRCEKATAYLLEEGFQEVYQLEGGILKYLETEHKPNSLWNGECFIFDNRGYLVPDTFSKVPGTDVV